ncbi:hypothetical protein A6R68_09323, partial [Neotoma lepida]
YSWSRLTPFKLKNRSVGLSTEKNAQGKAYFTLEGHKFMIVGGSIHYFRVPREYWRDRLLKLRACGFNTVTTWLLRYPESQLRTTNQNFVEAVDKYFDHLVPRILPLQYHHGGPVIAVQVENEYGSFSKDKGYMEYIKEALLKRGIVELLLTSDNDKGIQSGSVKGAMITLNMPSFVKDSFHKLLEMQALLKRGIVELLLTSDNDKGIQSGSVKGAMITLNMPSFVKDSFHKLLEMQNDKPIMVMEYWTGWYDTWGMEHNVKSANKIQNTVSRFIKYGISFNMYMFHGGTNFGFINGALHFNQHLNVVTSYGKFLCLVDYDAVLTEAGDYTAKYFKLRKLFASASAGLLPRLPPPTPKTVYPVVSLFSYLPLFDSLPYLNKPVMLYTPVTMENLPINNGSGQQFGLVLYETSICSGGQLYASVHDSAQVFLNNISIGVLDEDIHDLNIPKIQAAILLPLTYSPKQGCQLLRILVENQGRINFSWKMQNEQKGLGDDVSINGILLKNFTIYSLDMKMSFFKRLRSATWRLAPEHYLGPAFYLGTLKAGPSPKDTFLYTS